MSNLINRQRPPVFCPGCSHERAVQSLDHSLQVLDLSGEQVAIVTDIGCSGLFDTFFNTHALHGLHGRSLTYAAGLKMAAPRLTVIVVMGDGGLGIGGAHVLAACRRNLDMTLLVLNNFNYGMTGGQCSATTPQEAVTASGFLNRLEPPLDICTVAAAAGAPWAARFLATEQTLSDKIAEAIRYPGFALLDIWGVCPGRYLRRNRTSLKQLKEKMTRLPEATGRIPVNERPEFGAAYRRESSKIPPAEPVLQVETTFPLTISTRHDVLLLGAAGQHINTAGEIFCLAAMTAGLQVTQKNDYPITVLRGHSISEVVVSPSPIDYTGIEIARVIVALAAAGVSRRQSLFSRIDDDCLVIKASEVTVPPHSGREVRVDFDRMAIAPANRALASLAILVRENVILTEKMLLTALNLAFTGKRLQEARAVIERCLASQ